MNACTVGPGYCTKCENVFIVEVILEKKKVSNLRIRKRTEEEIKKLRIKAGLIISVFSLISINSLNIYLNYPFLYYLYYLITINPFVFTMYMGFNGIIILFIVSIIGVGLIYFSIKSEFKGYFLLIFGYLLFFLSLLTMPPDYYFDIRKLPIYLIFIDIPIVFMIIFGIILINKKEVRLPDIVGFLPIVFTIIFPFMLNHVLRF